MSDGPGDPWTAIAIAALVVLVIVAFALAAEGAR